MSTITLDDIQAEHNRLGVLIAALSHNAKPASQPVLLIVPEACITRHPGEHYSGAVLNDDGTVKHHLVVMADRPDGDLTWDAAMAWAEKVGGSLPDRQEQALIFANCKPHMKQVWHWSGEQHKDEASYAWGCDYFYAGYQDTSHKSAAGAAVAVRRVTP